MIRGKCFKYGLITLIMCIISSLLMLRTIEAEAADFTWSLGSDVPYSLDRIDGDPGIAWDGSDLWMIYTDDLSVWRRYKGTSMDNLERQPDGVLDSSFVKTHGDDHFWICGLWIDPNTGTWYTTVHTEFNYNYTPVRTCVRNIKLATSTDKGATWHNAGEIITSDEPTLKDECPGKYMSFGSADQKMFVDPNSGYIYCYYMNAWVEKSTNLMFKTEHVARSPISAKMAPGSWTKWYNGAWSQPAMGGHDSPLFASPCTATFVFYNTYLNKYVALGMKKDSNDGFISTCTSLASQNWTQPQKFCDAARLQWYHWVIDPNTWVKSTTGQTFRLYSAISSLGSAKYMDVTLGTGTQNTTLYVPDYSFFTESVFDYTAGLDQIPLQAYRVDFGSGMQGWTNKSGNGTWCVEGDGAMLSGTSNDTGTTLITDDNAGAISDGRYTFTVIPKTGQKFGAIFRYSSTTNYGAIKYDNGTFSWSNGSGQSGILFSQILSDGKAYRIDIDFTGSVISVKVDNVLMYSGGIMDIPINEGKEGFMVWNGSHTHFDNVVYTKDSIVYPTIFADDFEDGDSSGWITSGGTWDVITDGNKILKRISTGSAESIAYVNGFWSNYICTVRVKLETNNGTAGLLFRYKNANNYYMFRINKSNNNWEFYKKVEGIMTKVTYGTFMVTLNRWYSFNVMVCGDNVEAYIDGTQIFNGDGAVSEITYGGIAFRTYDIASIDDVIVVQ